MFLPIYEFGLIFVASAAVNCGFSLDNIIKNNPKRNLYSLPILKRLFSQLNFI